MAGDLVKELRRRLADARRIDRSEAFSLLRQLSYLVNEDIVHEDGDSHTQELLLRFLDRRQELNGEQRLLDQLARQVGLYPYIDEKLLDLGGQIAYEFHRPANLDDLVFHRVQADIYRFLMMGENVILSAPTSFGKSIVIDALVASEKYRNVVVVVPTIALADETRRRLSQRFRESYKIITHPTQVLAERNLLILTQERVVDHPGLPKVDLFVIDEFYKLDPRQDPERAYLLNQAFYRLHTGYNQFYFLGPNVDGIPLTMPQRFRCRFIRTDYATVVAETKRIRASKSDRLDRLVELCLRLDEPTLVYCASPASARRVAVALSAAKQAKPTQGLQAAADWAAREYLEEWAFVHALRKRIGLHHGKIPRALQQFVVRAFNGGLIDILICTSTLIEGVNTKAKNVVVYDSRVATRKVDFFTFNNIRGRSGRMFVHFIGHVYLFADPPQEDLPLVDIPLINQNEDVPTSLLIQLDDKDLSSEARERIKPLKAQDMLPVDVLRANSGLDPEAQLALARAIVSRLSEYSRLLAWRGFPDWDELRSCCELIWEFLVADKRRSGGVSSGAQLAYRINRFRQAASVKRLILEELKSQKEPDADSAVETVLDFVRQWAMFAFPRYLGALDRIQRHVLESRRLQSGDYTAFGAMVENCFLPAGIAALDEYGIPMQTGRRIGRLLGQAGTLDEALAALKRLDVEALTDLSAFERSLLLDSQGTI